MHHHVYFIRTFVASLFITCAFITSSTSAAVNPPYVACSIRSALMSTCDMLQSGLQSIGVNITWGALALNIQAQNGSSQKQSYLEYLKAHIAAYQPSSLVKWWFDFDLNNKQHQRMMMLCGGACLIASGLCFYYFKYKPIATLRDIADTMRKRNAAEDTRTRENDAFKRETIEVLKRIAQASEDRNKILKNGNNLLEVHNRLNLLQLQLKLKKFPLLTTDTHT